MGDLIKKREDVRTMENDKKKKEKKKRNLNTVEHSVKKEEEKKSNILRKNRQRID